ncbi:MAG: alkaline phosphatase family protein [Candidatus Heimdallarchaeota archaeon]|nr:MAG: alkaline phosphatase family protein [Candidatus Heimdallarchaeota archaeon]
MKSKKIVNSVLILLIFSSVLTMSSTLAYEEESTTLQLEEINTVSRVVIFSMDAFRYDYWSRTGDAASFEWIKEQGVTAAYNVPSNPSVTAVNHVSIITGNHPDKHGILGNTFYDWETNKSYSLFSDASDPYRDTNTGLHLMTTKPSVIHAEEQGIKTAVFAWPYVDFGTEFEGMSPTYLYDYDWFGANNLRTDKGIANKVADTLIDDPDIGLVYAWLPGVDSIGHSTGPDSVGIKQVIDFSLDVALRTFFEKLESAGLLEETVVILESDHGMAAVTDDDYFLETKSFYLDAVANTGLDPYIAHDAAFELLYFIGETNTTKVEEFAGYLYGQDGVQAVFVNDEHNSINIDNPARGVNISVWLEPGRSRNFGGSYLGMHGYLNNNTDMRGVFLAAGPGIAKNSAIGGIDMIDIAPTALALLGIESGFASDGSVLSSIYGTRTEAFSFPDMYAPSISTITLNPTEPRAGVDNVIEVKVYEFGTIVSAEAEITIDNGTVRTIDLEDIGSNNTFFGTMGDFIEGQVVSVIVTVEDSIGLQAIDDTVTFTVNAPQKTSYSLISLIALIFVVPYVYRKKRNN